MTLSQDLEQICDILKQRSIIDDDKIKEIIGDLFDKRLVEDLLSDDHLDLEEILSEMLAQSWIWVNDENSRGDIHFLKELIKTTKDYDELLPLYDNLRTSLKNQDELPRPKLPEGMTRDIINTFHQVGWIECRKFLSYLDLEESVLDNVEQNNQDTCSKCCAGLQIFQLNQDEAMNDRELIVIVINALENSNMIKLARNIRETYL